MVTRQGRRTPVRVGRRRSTGDVLAGIGALVLLAALMAGVPFALLTIFGSPLPDHVPSASDLTHKVGPGSLIAILVVLVWLAWIQLAACVVVEVYAGIRGVGVPARVPLAGGTQSLVHRLVVAALLLFTATTAIMPALAGGGLAQRPPAVQMQPQSQEFHRIPEAPERPAAAPAAENLAAHPTEKAATTKIYRVHPPEGRHHESLWEIAEKCLGEGRRYNEVYSLNKGHIQPDGTRLTIASLIRPGWILEMPADAKHAQVIPTKDLHDYFKHGHAVPDAPAKPSPAPPTAPKPTPPAQQTPPKQQTPPQQTAPPQRTPPAQQTPPAHQPPAHEAPPTQPPASQAPPAAPRPSAPQTPAPQHTEPKAPAQERSETAQPPAHDGGPERPSGETAGAFDVSWPHGLAAASLLAAGLLGALGRRRRTQMWNRAFGHMIVRPEGAAVEAERALRIGADDDAARLLDLGLRHMSKSMAAGGRALPTIYGVHLGRGSLDLWIAPADRNPPAPWQAFDDGQVWRLSADALPGLEASDLVDVLAPYPGLVSVGTNDNGRILVDLEAAHGLIALRGPEDTRRAVLSAVALELATNRWSDHMRITLVGFDAELGEGLREIAPDRVRSVPTLEDALPELEARSEEVRQALAASGVDSVLTGRCRGVFGEAWMPHYLIMADQPPEREADRLVALARTGTRMAAGYLVPGDVQGATWTWDVDAAGRLQAGVLGFDVEAQMVGDDDYRGVFELFRTAARLEPVELPGLAGGEEPPTAQESSVEVRLLGPIEVEAPGPMDESRRELCTELLVYLAAHPEGVHPTVLSGAVWPRGVSAGVRDACVARVSDWLGRDARGRPNLYYDDRGRIRLGSEVRVDLNVFRWLIWRSAAEPASETAYMAYALDLVRGPLLADRPRGRYVWLADHDLEFEAPARVIDVAHRLVVLRLEEGDPRGAVGAARAGLRLAPEDEGLWRDLLRATHATGDVAQVQVAVDELRGRVGRDPLFDGLQPETEALVEELLPDWHHVGSR
ncbi:bacterial transcriptional activator domain-containing protein [Actinomadura mexicana]|uniref:Transcriptional activator domain-containing protein n=1 Tax=Actinomadura mexicana TaxID=134959 RepID=A0A239C5M4_9ACTN|nr:bacterial transcriptional activator domain-containing protein [Actinomadura mexicana]SNS15506.1 transcriptional activator domain-containing protein [Actinomadura mexicana]